MSLTPEQLDGLHAIAKALPEGKTNRRDRAIVVETLPAIMEHIDRLTKEHDGLRTENQEAHNKLTWLASSLHWATDGRLSTAVRHVTEYIDRLRKTNATQEQDLIETDEFYSGRIIRTNSALGRVKALCQDTDCNWLPSDFAGNTVGDIRAALDESDLDFEGAVEAALEEISSDLAAGVGNEDDQRAIMRKALSAALGLKEPARGAARTDG